MRAKPDTAVLLAAHGSSDEPRSFASVDAHADRLRQLGVFGSVHVGFLRQSPPLRSALDAIDESQIVVVPMLMSAGYFAAGVFPRALGLDGPQFGQMQAVGGHRVAYTPPLGTHRGMVDVVAACADDACRDCDAATTTLMVIGHGSTRHQQSTDSVHMVTAGLRRRTPYAAVVAAFVDDSPSIAEVLSGVASPHLVVVPYFVADGPHVTRDIPTALERAPNHLTVHRCRAAGTHPGVDLLIRDLAALA